MARKTNKQKYLEQHAKVLPLPPCDRPLQLVIPALAEHLELPAMLASLEKLQQLDLARFIFVVNHGPEASESVQNSNQQALTILRDFQAESKTVKIEVIDQCAQGYFVKQKKCGVGLARRVGLDSCLASLVPGQNCDTNDPKSEAVLVCLDADTWTNPGYLTAINQWRLQHKDQGAASIPFAHRLPNSNEVSARAAIVTYELFLRYYVGGLRAIGHPYGHHSIGSAIVTRLNTYVAVRGMSLRLAAEDFYFLDKARKIAPIGVVAGAEVQPSARVSDRVIFGTGRFIMDQLAAPKTEFFYAIESFDIIAAVRAALLNDDETAINKLSIDYQFDFQAWLQQRKWPQTREQFLRNSGGLKAENVDRWFDGLETLKLAHEIRDSVLAPVDALTAIRALGQRLVETDSTHSLPNSDDLEQWLTWSQLAIQ